MSRILVIDDSEILSAVVRDFLVSHGHDVVSASSAEEGFRQVEHQLPDLILLDVQLPDVEGFELCRFFRARPETRHIPIIIITATATQVADKVRGLQSGADDYLVKPFEMPELLERIHAVLRRTKSAPAASPSPTAKPALATEASLPRDEEDSLPFLEAVTLSLLSPLDFPASRPLPPASIPFLMALFLLLGAGILVSPAVSVRPLLLGLVGCGYWGILVGVLVVAGSLSGIPLKWKEGARLLSLAGMPLLLKLAGGVVLGLATSLSPFLFTASPVLIWTHAPRWVARFDLFDLWASILLWIFLKKRYPRSPRPALVAGIVAGVGIALALTLQFGGAPW